MQSSSSSQPHYVPDGWNVANGSNPAHGTIRFDGNDLLSVPGWSAAPLGTMTSGFTVLAVMRSTPSGTAPAQNAAIAGWWDANGTGYVWAGLKDSNGLALPDLMRTWSLGTTQLYTGPHDLGVGDRHVVGWRYLASNQTLKLTVDGTTTSSSSMPPIPNLGSMPFIIGAKSLLPTGTFRGDLSELLIVPTALTDEVVQYFTDYARAQWTNLPAQGSADACVKANGQPSPDETRCDDDNDSTYGDQCTSGTCAGSQPLPGSPAGLAPTAWYHAGRAEVGLTEGVVSTWFDRTSHHLDLLAGFYNARPTLLPLGWNGNKPTIHFAGGNVMRRASWLGSPSGNDAEFSVLAVMRSGQAQNAGVAAWWNENGYARAVLQLTSTATDHSALHFWRQDDNGATQDASGADLDGGLHVVAWRHAPGVTLLTVDEATTQVLGNSTVGNITGPELLVGAASAFANTLFRGDISELVVFPRSLSSGELEAFRTYAHNEWGGVSTGLALDDGNPCTADSVASGVALHTPLPAGTACPDGNACNGAETCNAAGLCVAGAAPNVDDDNPCTTDGCNAASGVTHAPVAAATPCSDGNVCNGAEACNGSGFCVASAPPVLDDQNPCTFDACDALAGITHSARRAGSSCTDANLCNGAEICSASGACLAGVPPALDDGNPCTVDACSATGGVTHAPAASGSACADANPCNGSEACDGAGHCAAGAPPALDDDNACTDDSCDSVLGIRHLPLAAGASCDDPNVCNDHSTCNAAGTCVTSSSTLPGPCSGPGSLAVHLPRGLSLANVAVHAETTGVSVGASASIRGAGGLDTTTSVGSATTTVGDGARTGSIASVPPISVGAGAEIFGIANSQGDVQVAAGALIQGGSSPDAVLGPLSEARLDFEYPTATAPDQTATLLVPFTPSAEVAYGKVVLAPLAKMYLTAGEYHFNSLSAGLSSSVLIDNSQGPVTVFVHGPFTFRGGTKLQDSGLANVLFAVTGTQGVQLQALSFHGTVLAPQAPIQVLPFGAEYRGAFLGASVDLRPGVSVTSQPYARDDCDSVDDGCGKVFGCPALRVCPTSADLAAITPVAECVFDRPDGTHIGRFGYQNSTSRVVTIPAGTSNHLDPSTTTQFQPSVFGPGDNERRFYASFAGHVTWVVGSHQATLNLSSPKCTDIAEARDSPVIVRASRDNATNTANTGTETFATPLPFTIPPRLRVTVGGAGNGYAHFKFHDGNGALVDCTYRGRSSVAAAMRDIDRARGRFYNFVSCSDNSLSGTSTVGTDWSIELQGGDPTYSETQVEASIGPGCSELLEAPIAPDVSVQVRNDFSWENTTDLPLLDSDGLPALHYAWIYVETKAQVDALRRMRIFTSAKPIFTSDLQKYSGKCGIVDTSGDNTGIYLHAIVPAAVYNKWRDITRVVGARGAGTIPFRSIVFPTVPETAALNADGTLSWYALKSAGIQPILDPPADADALFGVDIPIVDDVVEAVGDAGSAAIDLVAGVPVVGDVIGGLVDVGGVVVNTAISIAPTLDEIIEVTADIAEGAWEAATAVIGVFDKFVSGTREVYLDIDVLNRDMGFDRNGPLVRAWGKQTGGPVEVAASNLDVELKKWVGEIGPASYTGTTDLSGRVHITVGAGGTTRGSGLCMKLENSSVQIISGLTENEFCAFSTWEPVYKIGPDFGDFQHDVPPQPAGGPPVFLPVRVDDWQVQVLAEMTDASLWAKMVMDYETPQVEVGVGAIANIVGELNGHRAVAPCFDFQNTEMIPLLISDWVGVATGSGALGIATYPLLRRDIFLPYSGSRDDGDLDHANSRGVAVHEYGHFLMCSLLFDISAEALPALIADRLPEGDTDAATDSTAILMETFADHIAGQVTGGTNYANPLNSLQTQKVSYCVPNALTCSGPPFDCDPNPENCNSAGPPYDCTETNYRVRASDRPCQRGAFADQVRQYVSLLHDVLDRPDDLWRESLGVPSNMDFWQAVTPGELRLTPADAEFQLDHDDHVSLPGFTIKSWIDYALEECNGHSSGSACSISDDKAQRGLGNTLLGQCVTWCDACTLFYNHDSNYDDTTDPVARWQACLDDYSMGLALADYATDDWPCNPDPASGQIPWTPKAGVVPATELRIAADTCMPCPAGQVSLGGVCQACPALQVPIGNTCQPCPADYIQSGTSCVRCPEGQVSSNNACVACQPWEGEIAGQNRCETCSIDASLSCSAVTCEGEFVFESAPAADNCPDKFRLHISDLDHMPSETCPDGLTVMTDIESAPRVDPACSATSAQVSLYVGSFVPHGDLTLPGQLGVPVGNGAPLCEYRGSLGLLCSEVSPSLSDADVIVPGPNQLIRLYFGPNDVVVK